MTIRKGNIQNNDIRKVNIQYVDTQYDNKKRQHSS
jgi:hypothetical protein